MQALRKAWNQPRLFLAIMPTFGAVALAGTALQGNPEILRSREAYAALMALSVFGGWCARRIGRALSEVPVVRLDATGPGYIAVQGVAQPLERGPLDSPVSGSPCVWYRESRRRGGSVESRFPFLLVDADGRCLVDPTGAEIEGLGGRSEEIIAPGASLFVLGELMPAERTPLELSQEQVGRATVVVRATFPAEEAEAARAELHRRFEAEVRERDAEGPVQLPRLPMMTLPADGRPFIISAVGRSETRSWYRLLEVLAWGVLGASAAGLAWTSLSAGG